MITTLNTLPSNETTLKSFALGDAETNLPVQISNWIPDWAAPVKLVTCECHRTPYMIMQHSGNGLVHQATNHYLSNVGHTSTSPYGVIRPQLVELRIWVNGWNEYVENCSITKIRQLKLSEYPLNILYHHCMCTNPHLSTSSPYTDERNLASSSRKNKQPCGCA